jgi:glycerol-3-phosphate dehydrogenase
MNRSDLMGRILEHKGPWDVVIIGGGATGVGIAVDAASRGYQTVLFERDDFGKGTSSRSTKLVHGGVRYLEQGNVPLVMEALKERGMLKENAPHLVKELPFVVPNYEWWEAPFYGVGLRLYDLLAGKYGFGPSRNLSKEETLEKIPTLQPEGLRGGVIYYDGQFDDSRLLVQMAMTAVEQGAAVVNYCGAKSLRTDASGRVSSVVVEDRESGNEFEVEGRVIINATGPFSDTVRQLADAKAPGMVAPSQGVHIVLNKSFVPAENSIMVPHTSDGRVMFAIPWHGHTVVGTTDTAVTEIPAEPVPMEQEIEFILQTASLYLENKPKRSDILSVWAGIRPLVRAPGAASTSALSRDHSIHIDPNGLITIAGGKWTTYRKMAEDCVDQAALIGGLDERECVTKRLRIHGYHHQASRFGHMQVFGGDAVAIQDMIRVHPERGKRLHDALPYTEAEVIWAARWEMARTVEDVLARRTRALFLNAGAATAMAPRVAELLAAELGKDVGWQKSQVDGFRALAQGYLVS